jgi:hypothetical protein
MIFTPVGHVPDRARPDVLRVSSPSAAHGARPSTAAHSPSLRPAGPGDIEIRISADGCEPVTVTVRAAGQT